MASKTATVVGIIVLALVVAAILYGSGFFQNVSTGEQEGAATLAFSVKFKDGTSHYFETSNIYTGQLSVVPLSLFVGGKEIEGIDIYVKVKLYTGGRTVTKYSAQITQRIEIYKSGQASPITSSTGKYNPSGGAWNDGETKTIHTTSLTSAQIENAISQYSGNGDYYFQAVVQISLTVSASDGNYTLSGSAVGGVTITFQDSKAMSMECIVQVTPLRLVTP